MIESFLEARMEGDLVRASYHLHPKSLSHFREILTALHGKLTEKLVEPELLWQATGFEVIPTVDQVSDFRFFHLCVERLSEEARTDTKDWTVVSIAEGDGERAFAILQAEQKIFGVSSRTTRAWTIRFFENEPRIHNAFYNNEVAQLWLRQAAKMMAASEGQEYLATPPS